MSPRILPLILILMGCAPLPVAGARAESGNVAADAHAHQRIPPGFAEGLTIEIVHVHLRNPSGNASLDERARTRIADRFGIRPGARFDELMAKRAESAVAALPFVEEVEYRVYSVSGGRQVAVALLVTLRPAEEEAPPGARGALVTRKARDLPTLWQDERSLLKLIFNPTLGFYADRDPWVGNAPAFVGKSGEDRTYTTAEAGLELGIGGITRLGGSNSYIYGAASYIGSTTQGEDVFVGDSSRVHGGLEDLYLGLLVAEKDGPRSFNLSVGRQKFSLNRNLLVGHVLGASNGGERAATNLSPRNAYDLVVDARFQSGAFTLQAWFADPDELPASDTETQLAGLNFKYNNNRNIDASLTLLGVPHSKTRYPLPSGTIRSREGLRAVNPRIRWTSAFGVPGLWLEGEWAHQWHEDFDMSAEGWGAWLGYTFQEARWRPGAFYRYAQFTGDDPATTTYERFDALTGGVQRDWAQGMDMIKIATNRNLRTHRVEVSFKPVAGMDISIDYYYFLADTANNLGGQPALSTYGAEYLGQEITPTVQWTVNKNLYFQSFLSIVKPGGGLKGVLPDTSRTWKTLQLSFYWFY